LELASSGISIHIVQFLTFFLSDPRKKFRSRYLISSLENRCTRIYVIVCTAFNRQAAILRKDSPLTIFSSWSSYNMAEPGEFFGYASLRSDIERLSTPPRIRTRAETLELMRQREKDAMAQQSRNKEQFEYKEAERKKKLKSTIDAWFV
jgi:hypothetical protein